MNNDFVYQSTLVIEYSDNREYRHCLRNLFLMKADNYKAITNDDAYDEETRDEMGYDDSAAIMALDYIYANTKDNEMFRELYLLGAATMFSDGPAGRTNFFNYTYTLFQLCVLLDQKQYLPYITLLKDPIKQREQDAIWKQVCNYLDWEFYSTI